MGGDEENSLSPTEVRQALTDANKLSLVQQQNREKMVRVIKTLPGGSVSNPILDPLQAMAFSRPSTAGAGTPGFHISDWQSHVLETFEKANLLHDGLSAEPARIMSAPSTDQVLKKTQRQTVSGTQKESVPKKQPNQKDFSFGKPHKADDFVFGRITPLQTARHKRWERMEMERQAKLQKIALKATRRNELVRCRCLLEHIACARFGKILYNSLMKRHKAKERAVKFGAAQTRIARWYRSMVLMERFKVTVALAHIQSLAFGVKMHLRRRRIAIRRIRTFFAETKRIHQVIFAKKKFCGAVRVLQRAARDYKMCTAARMKCLYMIWDIAAAEYVRETNAGSNDMSDQEESMLLLNVPSNTDLSANGADIATTTNESTVTTKKPAGNLPIATPSNRTDTRARRLEWQRRRQDLQMVARGKLLRKQLQDFEETCNRAWHRIDGRIEKVRMKLVKSKVVPGFSSKTRYFCPRIALVPIEMRNSLMIDLLVRIRRSHQERWSGEANRIRYREASKKFSTIEARNILSLRNPRTPPLPVPPPDRRVKEWPVLAFFIPFERCHVSDGKRLQDLVALVYRGAVDEVESTGGLTSPRSSAIHGKRHRRHSLL